MKEGQPSGSPIKSFRMSKTANMTGWSHFIACAIIFGTFGTMLWPILVDPLLHVDKYKEAHKRMQTELFQAGILPGDLKKWDDPYNRKK